VSHARNAFIFCVHPEKFCLFAGLKALEVSMKDQEEHFSIALSFWQSQAWSGCSVLLV